LIAGATSGIGRAMAHRLASDTVSIAAVARTLSKLDAKAGPICTRHVVEVCTVSADLSPLEGIVIPRLRNKIMALM